MFLDALNNTSFDICVSLVLTKHISLIPKLYLLRASQVNSIQSNRQNLEEACASFLNSVINIYQEGKYDQNNKYNLHTLICGYLLKFTILSKENLENIIKPEERYKKEREYVKEFLVE